MSLTLGCAILRPVRANGKLDVGALKRHIKTLLAAGVTVFLVGSSGERDDLTPEQRLAMLKVIREVVGTAAEVFADITHPVWRVTLRLVKNLGPLADNLLMLPADKLDLSVQVERFRLCADAMDDAGLHAGKSLFAYDAPILGRGFGPGAYAALSSENNRLRGMKLTAADPFPLVDMMDTYPSNRGFCGWDKALWTAGRAGVKACLVVSACAVPGVVQTALSSSGKDGIAAQRKLCAILDLVFKIGKKEPWQLVMKEFVRRLVDPAYPVFSAQHPGYTLSPESISLVGRLVDTLKLEADAPQAVD